MTPERRRQFSLVVNPTAGKGRALVAAGAVERALRTAGAQVQVLAASTAEQALAWAGEAVQDALSSGRADEHCVVAVGGDGTVHLVLQAVGTSGVPIGIVPAGSGDDAARMWGIPRNDPQAAAHVLLEAPCTPRDLGRAEGPDGQVRWFATVLAAGFDARVSERALEVPQLPSSIRYLVALAAELRGLAPIRYRLVLDDDPVDVDAMIVAAGNGPSYGGGMLVCPEADPADGLLDVLIVHPLPTREFLRVFPRVYRGTHLSHPAVEVRRATRVRVEAPAVVAFADGERVGPLPQQVSVCAGALRVLTTSGA